MAKSDEQAGSSNLRIDVLGTVITISSDEDPEYLNKLLDKYRKTIEKVQNISGLKDPLKTAVLTGFLLCDDLEKAGTTAASEKREETGEAEKLTLGMISRLDELVSVDEAPGTLHDVREHMDAEEEAPADESSSIAPLQASYEEYKEKFPAFFKLENTVKNYEWGSTEWLPALIGQRNLSRIPWAELWMGVNPAGPSRVVISAEGNNNNPSILPLSELINREKEFFLGKETAETYGTLPFLFKVIAAEKPLSIQVHPNLEQAREGFERENQAGIPLDSSKRNYKNPNHKPEIICALDPFAALCGFRELSEISVLIGNLSSGINSQETDTDRILKASLGNLVSALGAEEENPYEAFLTELFCMGNEERMALGPYIKKHMPRLERDFPEYRDEWELCSYFASLYPGDPGILAPLYLNILELNAGEAIYLPAGIFHSYIHGMGIELMADSDNVLRGGLTPKHVDPDELLRVLSFTGFKPEIIKNQNPLSSLFTYPTPSREFALSAVSCTGEEPLPLAETGPSIAIVTQGTALVTESEGGTSTIIQKGESIFIPAGKKSRLSFSGTFTAYVASIGVTGHIS